MNEQPLNPTTAMGEQSNSLNALDKPPTESYSTDKGGANVQQKWISDYSNSGVQKDFKNLTITFKSQNAEQNEDKQKNAKDTIDTMKQMGRQMAEKAGEEVGKAAGEAVGDAVLPGVGGMIGREIGGKLGKEAGGKMADQASDSFDNNLSNSGMSLTPLNDTSFMMQFANVEQMNQFMPKFNAKMSSSMKMDEEEAQQQSSSMRPSGP